LDLSHHFITRVARKKLFDRLPSSHNGALRVLDYGTGTGIWAREVADGGKVVGFGGLHLVPIRPLLPKNTFFTDDESLLWEQEDRFDLIHTRVFSYDRRNWLTFIKKAYDRLKPGGWLEQEALNLTVFSNDPATPPNSLLETLVRDMHKTTDDKNEEYLNFGATKAQLEDAGFINVKETIIELPIVLQEETDPNCHKLSDWFKGVLQFLLKSRPFPPPFFQPGSRPYCKL
ncbi:hypothetical protein LZ31DRAFT_486049, partial [Colletotrichum somersetense]